MPSESSGCGKAPGTNTLNSGHISAGEFLRSVGLTVALRSRYPCRVSVAGLSLRIFALLS